jgi:hypothetical protein
VLKQQHLTASARVAGAGIVSAEFFDQVLVAVDDAITAFDVRLGGETVAAFAGDLKSGRALPSGPWRL